MADTGDDGRRAGAARRPRSKRSLGLVGHRGGRGETAATIIHRELRLQIVTLKRQPGEPIVEKEIALEFGVSRTPVREALLRLADEELIEVAPQSGTYVALIPVARVREAILVRRALEGLTVRLAAERASGSQIAEMMAIVERQREAAAAGDAVAFYDSDDTFHAQIARMAGHPGIWSLIHQVKTNMDRYRRMTLPLPGRMPMVIDQHVAVADAIARRDAAIAIAMMDVHLDALFPGLDQVRTSHPEFFVEDSPDNGSDGR
ncbi:MAG: FCD domain-containing protein [Azospirillum sp.]|nr:FCD domain-containing protein [Azospirillum sp.]